MAKDKSVKSVEREIPFCQVIAFNPLVDAKEVESGLAVNIDDMMKTGIVKDASSNLDNNGIDDPNAVIGMVRDEFAAIDAQRALKKYAKESKARAQKAAETAAKVGAPAPTAEPAS